MFRNLVKILAAVALVAFAGLAFAEEEWVGKKADDFTFSDSKGTSYTVSNLTKEGKVVWINFWGLRCGPCIRELPALEKLNKDLGPKGLVIFGVNADGVDADFINKSFAERDDLKSAGVNFALVPDPDFKLVDAFALMGAPLNIIIDKAGIIRFYHEGYETGDEAHYEKVVQELLGK